MKPRFANQKTAALTLTEVLLVIAALALLAAILLPVLAASKRKSSRLGCANQLQQVGLAYRMWANDNLGLFPMQISVATGGAMELITTGNVAACFGVLSNTINNPAMLVCPNDTKHLPAINFETLSNPNISYFVGLDAIEVQPQTLLAGDDNLMVNGTNVQSGILDLHTNNVLAWTKERHRGDGNILLGDGSAQQVNSADLTAAARLATNRLAIP